MKILLQGFLPEGGALKELEVQVENGEDSKVLTALEDEKDYITFTGSLTRTKAGSLTSSVDVNTWIINKDKIIAVIH